MQHSFHETFIFDIACNFTIITQKSKPRYKVRGIVLDENQLNAKFLLTHLIKTVTCKDSHSLNLTYHSGQGVPGQNPPKNEVPTL